MAYKNKEDKKEWSKKYYGKNKEYFKEYTKKWRENNPEKYQNNKIRTLEKEKEYKKKWRKKHPDKIIESNRKYFKTEKGKANNQRTQSKRRAIMKNIINTLTSQEWLDILKQHNFKCVYCGEDLFNLFAKPERDHIVPISKGGDNVKENIVPSCRSCNAKKSNKILSLVEKEVMPMKQT